MKKIKKYLKFLFVLPLFILALFVNLTISADEIVVADNTVNTVNTNSLLTYNYNEEYFVSSGSSATITGTVINPTTFNNQNYSYNSYYNNNLSFINYNYFKQFPNYLKNFYINVSGLVDSGGQKPFNLTVKADIILDEYTRDSVRVVNLENEKIYVTFSKCIRIISSNFNILTLETGTEKNAYVEIFLCYNEDTSLETNYIGSTVRLISTASTAYIDEFNIELFNDLSTFNTYLDSLDSGDGGYDLGFNDGYNEGYEQGVNDGYNEGYEQGVIDTTPSANITDNLFLSYGIYSNDNQILVNDLFEDSDFTQLNELKPGIIYNLITDEGASANTILISLKSFASNSGYILNMFNGEYSSFELKILGNGGKVLYTNVYDSTSYQISQLLSVVGDNVIIDAISFTFQDIENAENFYISFTNTLLNEAFQNGYNVGIFEGEPIGYAKGYDDGYRLGHTNGYNEGMSSQFNLGSTLLEIADIPIKLLSSMLSFEVLGINVFGLFTGLVTVLVVLWVVKKFIV